MRLPSPVHRGDRVAVIAPAGPSPVESLTRGLDRLRAHYDVTEAYLSANRAGFLADTDAARAASLLGAVRDRTVRAVVATRGGYGCTRVLEQVGEALTEALRDDPKMLVGFSDLTALHGAWSRAGVVSLHGPMVTALGDERGRSDDWDEVRALLAHALPAAWTALDPWVPGAAEGRAVGGNLALLAASCGTAHAPMYDDAVLFLEDLGERPYRLDRMLTQLRLSGALRSVRGVVLGGFSECVPGGDGVTATDVLRERLGDLRVPVYAGAPFGHGHEQRPIPLGALAILDGRGGVHFTWENTR